MFDIITVGAATKDVFLVSDQFQILASKAFETGVGECVALGSKIEIDELMQTTGGGATNAAVTFARLGFKTGTICRIGKDSAGQDVLAALKKDGVGTSLVVTDAKAATAYSTLLTTKTGERTILVYRGASATFSAKDIPFGRCGAKWFYITSLGGNVALASRLVAHAEKCGASVAWNPGGKELDAGLKKLLPIIRRVRVFSVNREEGAKLTGKADVRGIIDALASEPTIVIVTDGRDGAYVHADGTTLFAPGSGKQATSQTGAGDAFGSGFVAGFVKTESPGTALVVAMLNAQSVIEQVGAKAGILKAWPTARQMSAIRIEKIEG